MFDRFIIIIPQTHMRIHFERTEKTKPFMYHVAIYTLSIKQVFAMSFSKRCMKNFMEQKKKQAIT